MMATNCKKERAHKRYEGKRGEQKEGEETAKVKWGRGKREANGK